MAISLYGLENERPMYSTPHGVHVAGRFKSIEFLHLPRPVSSVSVSLSEMYRLLGLPATVLPVCLRRKLGCPDSFSTLVWRG